MNEEFRSVFVKPKNLATALFGVGVGSTLPLSPLGYQPFNSLNLSSRSVAGFVSIIKLEGWIVEPIPRTATKSSFFL